MPWIDDVVTHTTIRSVWGNTMRDHVVHVFASKAERDAQAVPRDGMLCHTSDTHITYVRVGGAWYVLAMPWRPFTPKAWFADVNGNGRTLMGNSSVQVALWSQSMGQCHVVAQYVAVLPATTSPTDVTVNVGVPLTAAAGGPAGYARIVASSTAAAYGGGTSYAFNDSPSGSGYLVVNVGHQVVPSNATIRNATTAINLFVDTNLTYACDPTVDTP